MSEDIKGLNDKFDAFVSGCTGKGVHAKMHGEFSVSRVSRQGRRDPKLNDVHVSPMLRKYTNMYLTFSTARLLFVLF